MVSDPNADLLKQLTRIADAMNTKGASAWLDWAKNLTSFVAGIITAYLSLLLQSRLSDKREQTKMRRIVYAELAQCFVWVDSMVRASPTPKPGKRVRYSVLKEICAYDGETYMKENRPVFYGLHEGVILSATYNWFHKLSAGGTYGLSGMKAPLRFFSRELWKDPKIKRNFKRFASSADFSRVQDGEVHYRDLATFEELVDSGEFVVVPEAESQLPKPE
jgi:hypothetical protein